MKRIDRFQGSWRFLSNFYPVEVELDGEAYPTVEHAYQAAKTLDKASRFPFTFAAAHLRLRTPGDAKRAGRRLRIRPDWEQVKRDVMCILLRRKFAHAPLRGRLLGTGDAELIEGNTWGDTYWGVCQERGHNWLGRLLMQVRAELALEGPVASATEV